ncbi:conserved hypothetical protein [Uncinocarpus reesii 1704]|uniref:RNA helicase n=1 Tax=Uncinocarpus reesii (strain UAMH 1704) TaxID=336963 RepID=C4JT95_UNCRE|nr:uncharacterized protein UREG_05684 [Uncinocarpus reesii 1704]EEP80842.1 conserved hypothetical protein [Uncinocarpus reesii 1704]
MAKRPLPIESNAEPKRKKNKKNESTTPKLAANGQGHNLEPSAVKNSTSPYIPNPELDSLPQATVDEYLKANSIDIADQGEAEPLRPITSFSFLPQPSEPLYRPLKAFSAPTPIQAVSWPLAFAGRDVIGVAETGSGKTLAFGLPCLRKILELNSSRKSRRLSAVIITPTRELAMQIYDQLLKFTSSVDVGIACIYGGAPKDQQRREARNASIIVATPGRLKDFQSEQGIDLSKVKYLVLDEADRMLDKGFEQDIRDIIGTMPSARKRQTIMFTATWPDSVKNLAATFTRDPVTITIGERTSDIRANDRIKQVVEVLNPHEKDGRLLEVIRKYQGKDNSSDSINVFCLYKKEAMRVVYGHPF